MARTLYPDSSTDNAIGFDTLTVEKSASWDDAPHSSSVTLSVPKSSFSTAGFWVSEATHNSATWPTTAGTISVDVTSTANLGTSNAVYGRRATNAGGSGPSGNYSNTVDMSTTGIKVAAVTASQINLGTTSATDSLALVIYAMHNGGHTTGSITIDDSDTYFYHPDLIKLSSFIPRRPRTIPGVAVSQSSRW